MAKKNFTEFTPTESKKAFRSSFERLSHTQSYSTVFSDFVEFALLMMNIGRQPSHFKELEDRWPKESDHKLFAEMFFNWSNCCDPYEDALGDLFMECVSFGRNGQFFTPEPICELMAMMQLQGAELKEDLSICDCACGSGRTLLSAAKVYRSIDGFTPQYDMKYYAADNDPLCVKMTVLNFLINTMPGEVAHMNSLSMEHFKSYHIRKIRHGDHYLPYYYVTGANNTDFIQRLKSVESQPQESKIELTPPALNKHGQFIMF